MNTKNIRILENQVNNKFLPYVRRPSRYIGGEVNQTKKDLSACNITVALCFPDMYEIAMSHTGLSILYHILNQIPDVAAERLFTPWADAEDILRKEQIPLFTLESKAAAADMDIIGISISNELCYSNVLNILDLAQLPLRSADRTDDHPLIIAGGQMANSCEPIADFIDLFVLGDGEEAIVEIVNLVKKQKQTGATRRELLLNAAKTMPWVYVPSLYTTNFDDNKTTITPNDPSIPDRLVNTNVRDFDLAPLPDKPIVPFAEAVHERVSIEIMRGCPGRCRFCQASFCKRPISFRSVDRIVEMAIKNYEATGFDTVSLLSLSSADYPHLEELVEKLQQYFTPKQVGISLPSLKVKEQLQLLPKMVSSVRKAGLTIAVEAAGEKLRQAINKPITDADLFAGIEAAYRAGFEKVKLYFMVGFPGETEQDIANIVDLAHDIARLKRKVDKKTANINVAISWLVPKPHTPLGYVGQKSAEYFVNAKKIIIDRKYERKAGFLRFNFHGIEQSTLESAIARGDRRLGNVIESAFKAGARFDLWSECFNTDIWHEAFKAHNMDLDQAAQKSYDPNDTLPWQHLGGPNIKHLKRHYDDTMNIIDQ